MAASALGGAGCGADVAHHGHEAVGARRRQVLVEPYLLDEVEVGVENLAGSVAVDDLQEHGDDALDDDSVGVGREVHPAVGVGLGVEPHAALASLNQMFGSLVALVDGGQGVAHVYDYGIAVHPVVKIAELLDYLVL